MNCELTQVFPEKKKVVQVWTTDGVEGSPIELDADYIYEQAVSGGTTRLVVEDGEGGLIGGVMEGDCFVIRSTAQTGKALSFSDFAEKLKRDAAHFKEEK